MRKDITRHEKQFAACMCIINAFFPTASKFLGLFLSSATIEGSLTTTSSLCMISVLAVPRSIAISCVKKLKSPIILEFSYIIMNARKIEVNKLNNKADNFRFIQLSGLLTRYFFYCSFYVANRYVKLKRLCTITYHCRQTRTQYRA